MQSTKEPVRYRLSYAQESLWHSVAPLSVALVVSGITGWAFTFVCVVACGWLYRRHLADRYGVHRPESFGSRNPIIALTIVLAGVVALVVAFVFDVTINISGAVVGVYVTPLVVAGSVGMWWFSARCNGRDVHPMHFVAMGVGITGALLAQAPLPVGDGPLLSSLEFHAAIRVVAISVGAVGIVWELGQLMVLRRLELASAAHS